MGQSDGLRIHSQPLTKFLKIWIVAKVNVNPIFLLKRWSKIIETVVKFIKKDLSRIDHKKVIRASSKQYYNSKLQLKPSLDID